MEKLKNLNEILRQDVREKFKDLYGAEMAETVYDDLPQNVKIHLVNLFYQKHIKSVILVSYTSSHI